MPLILKGFVSHRGVILEELIDGEWTRFDQSVKGMDYWQTEYDPITDTYVVIFNIEFVPSSEELLTRTFRVMRIKG